MAPYRGNYKNTSITSIANGLNKEELLEKYLKEFRVEQCPLFLQHKCQQHRPFTCFNWHFQNQRRRRPVRRRDGTFNYSADAYCTKYDETTGLCPDADDCPYLHRTAGDTERRYHLKYYKTGMCVHDTDNRGYCVKNGPHCAFAHGGNDLRPPVYDIRELQAIENGEADSLTGPNSLDKERNLLNDDPKWLDTTYVLANYKTEPCKKPPRLCRQGYACPQFHNSKDKRRSPKKYKYRSTPCPQVKSGDEWGDPVGCEAGDSCQYCHTRTEQQFHPEIYKSTKCNDIQNTSYCPRGPFCAFAHVEQETVSLDSPPPDPNGHHLGEHLMSRVLNGGGGDHGASDVSCHPALSSAASNELHPELSGLVPRNNLGLLRNGSITPPFEENGVASPIDDPKMVGNGKKHHGQQQQQQQQQSSINNLSSSMDSASNNAATFKNRFLSGDQAMLGQHQQALFTNNAFNNSLAQMNEQKRKLMMEAVAAQVQQHQQHQQQQQQHQNGYGNGMFFTAESLDSIGNPLEELSLDQFDGKDKSRKASGYSDPSANKSRQCSGFDQSNQTKSRNCSGNSLTHSLASNGLSNPVMIPNDNGLDDPTSLVATSTASLLGMNQLGLFDLTSAGSGAGSGSASSTSSDGSPKDHMAMDTKDQEIIRLREELTLARQQRHLMDKRMSQANQVCEALKKETKKVELALKEKEAVLTRLQQQDLGRGPYLHAIKRVAELKHLPAGVLKSLEWQLKKDLQEVIRAQQLQSESLLGVNHWAASNNNRLFDFPNNAGLGGLGLGGGGGGGGGSNGLNPGNPHHAGSGGGGGGGAGNGIGGGGGGGLGGVANGSSNMDWSSLGLINSQHQQLYGSLAQQ